MLKSIPVILLLFAFTAQTFHKTFIVFDYYANTEAFEKNCENKAKPILKCKGKCQMMKKLQEEEKKDQRNPDRKAENKNEIQIFPPIESFSHNVSNAVISMYGSIHEIHFPKTAITEVFHPPAEVM